MKAYESRKCSKDAIGALAANADAEQIVSIVTYCDSVRELELLGVLLLL